ncbi:TRAP transporter small permease subunit [Enterovibrio nigricans]|uniref:TRAP transporter small permease protein n=1 Tax=Enterovibrio nigricans DSM 22720 TaxID=1121868 RepID=A0A1T4VD93_9GAMM|nr:TRAP transporter small permease subunit [Enterovibrio nigricans]PKF49524.1 C4-dicarboxylate ABC transporter [Enterovibrio nigricans]SKA62838.1 TRAP-type mannitol/chloroaromatic compound transport system, small permease component [Enterovibrio nigricans DSM 22720]
MTQPSHPPPLSSPLADSIEHVVRLVGRTFAWSYLVLVLVIIAQVVLRKVFNNGQIALEELQWHLYAIGVLFGLSYAEITGTHVRVDIFYHRFTAKAKAWVEVVTVLFFVWPFMYVIFIHSLDFVYEAWRVGERSNAPSGLPWRWLIKSAIPFSAALLAFASLARLLRAMAVIRQGGQHGSE